MPMFDFHCEKCDHDFEAFVRATVTPDCPKCTAQSVTRRLSSFGVGSSGSSAGTYLGRSKTMGGFGCRTGCACH
ncbi:MAG: FmdB family zinc ribbon protein [Burkholderiales bacterium]